MHRQHLATRPGILYQRGAANIGHLFNDIQFAQAIEPLIFRGDFKDGLMFIADILHMPQPVVDQPQPPFLEHGAHPATAIMTDHHDVPHLEYVNGKLHHRQAVQITMHHEVGDIAMHEHFTGVQAGDRAAGTATVRTADPEVFGMLLRGQTTEKFRIIRTFTFGPGAVIGKQM